jgi:hypothetical protein
MIVEHMPHTLMQKILARIKQISIPTKYIFLFFMLLAAVIGLISWTSSLDGVASHTRYNNFVIFKQSFFHLIHNQDIYTHFPAEHYDVFKYSPTFSLWMSWFAYFPDVVGLILFNLVNVIVLIIGLRYLPLSKQRLNMLLFFIVIETLISLTSSQTNILITGLLILGWHFMEKGKPWWAALMIVLTIYIKIFGVVALALFLFYPTRWKAALATICWSIVIGLLPLMVISPEQLVFLYKSWGTLLTMDHNASVGVSFYGWLHSWFGFDISKPIFVLAGALIFCIPLLRFKNWGNPAYRLTMLASVLIWVVIFNHKGESPTYVLAIVGVAIWYFIKQTPSKTDLVLLLLALVFTSFSSTDVICPYYIAKNYVEPYSLKAVFCTLIWFKLIYDLATDKPLPVLN